MYHFCTYFDRNYLVRGLTLFRSLERYCTAFRLFVLCLDEESFVLLSQLGDERVQPVSLADLEAWEPRLLQAKANRSCIEYYFTISPFWPRYLLHHYPDIDILTYLDADLYFYSSPEPIYEELGDQSILIVEHRFPEHLEKKLIYGRFNVQYQSFRNDEQGLACLTLWGERCLDWCFDRLEDGKFADQKYLDDWPERYDRLVILLHQGAGLAPWNWSQYRLKVDHDKATVDEQPLIFYHFHGVKLLTRHLISHGLASYDIMPASWRNWFYRRYVQELRATTAWVAGQLGRVHSLQFYDIRTGKGEWRSILSAIRNRQLMWVA